MGLRTAMWVVMLAAAPLLPAAEPLNVKTGLWQIDYAMDMQGMLIPESVLAQMPPDQRAKVEASMRQRAAQGTHRNVMKSCIKAEDLARGAFNADPDSKCRNTVVKQTANHQEMTFVCQQDGETRTGRMTLDALSNERIRSNVEIETPKGKVKTTMDGKWLGKSCAGEDD
ncbi:MAG: DUF3617 family protein [Steroidobacteraceae bacterium]